MNGVVKTHQPVIVVHGGAWKIPDHMITDSEQGAKLAALEGYKVLKSGGSCIDAVVKAVSSLEDNPAFDAGRGSVLNEAGGVEMHALVMRGDTCDVGGVLCIQHARNPVQVARIILDESPHCLLAGEAGLKMARKHNLPEENIDYFITDHVKEELKNFDKYTQAVDGLFNTNTGHDTVGAVALDCHGNLACATSTGGITAQQVGRVSDSPIVGSGGYADNESVAVSTTGHGESIMKVNLAKTIACYVEAGLAPKEATAKALKKMNSRVGGSGGAISVDTRGRVGVHFTTERMTWAKIGGSDVNGVVGKFVEFGCDATNVKKESV
uniref:Isoaspartyl peptidase/L-asparaginase n=1 Tax=Phallusia mammillata TaxID=59560 RepID=A0A6F9D6A0_9ASCI|nr:isoaspartyl peptidase/L-asparaginase [Phallusia mammillata]